METEEPKDTRLPGPSTHHSFSRIKVTNIPVITDLRKELDYGHAHERRDIVFYNTVRSYIFTFTSSKGIPGADLLRWKFRPHQSGLLEMATQFLDHDGKGAYFWPDDPASANHGKLRYSEEPRRIKRLLVQLFFKINQQHKWKGSHKTMPSSQSSERLSPRLSPNRQESDNPSWSATNSQHRSSEVRQPADVNNRQRGHSVEDAIDVDSFAFYESFAADQKPDQSAWDDATMSTPEPSYSSQSFLPLPREAFDDDAQGSREEASEPRMNAPMASMAPMNDVFDGLSNLRSDAPVASERATNGMKRPAPHEHDDDVPRTKRSRSQNPPNDEELSSGPASVEALDSQCPLTTAAPVPARGSDDSQGTNAETEQVPPPLSMPGELPKDAAEEDSQTTQSRNESHPLPRTVPDSDAEPKLTPKPHPEHEPENESSKQRRASPKVNLIFSVNVSQTLNKLWSPRGTFQQKSLGDLEQELPIQGNFRGLHFLLEAPGNKGFEAEILLGDEVAFQSMKNRFQKRVMEIRRNHTGSTEMLYFEITITPLRDEDGEGEESLDDDLIIF
ncbi:hypothetical protein BKA56DRAFT_610367 [Ilyonectria sp. MPI-CAGE-AT-0026]|nr:hypothetical protein BKA56DRAFT_610367 [Ilyonectria sp. MPI-CAGE-AT-0026]